MNGDYTQHEGKATDFLKATTRKRILIALRGDKGLYVGVTKTAIIRTLHSIKGDYFIRWFTREGSHYVWLDIIF